MSIGPFGVTQGGESANRRAHAGVGARTPTARAAVRRAARVSVEGLESRLLLSTTLTSVADADVEFLASKPSVADANFGNSGSMRAGGTPDDQFISYVKFNIAGVSNVGQATLSLLGSESVPSDGTNAVSVFPVADSSWVEGPGAHPAGAFDPGTITWNNRPAISSPALATAFVSGRQTYTWDVTSYVQQARAQGLSLISFALEGESDKSPAVFDTKELGTVPPTLVIGGDALPPSATFTTSAVTSASQVEQVTATYQDNAGIDTTSITPANLAVTGPAGTIGVGIVSVNVVSATEVQAVYTLATPGGAWTAADNGVYSVTLAPGQVRDFAGRAAEATPGSFLVSIPAAGDTTPPTAAVAASTFTNAAGTARVAVVYTDNVVVDPKTIAPGNITVARPGGPALTVTGVTASAPTLAPGGGTSITAVYTLAPPPGGWDASDNGAYAVTVAAGSVKDTSGNGVAGAAGTFTVGLPDLSPPSAAISAPDVTAAGAATETVTVVYSDNVAVQAATIGNQNLSVSGPGGTPLAVTAVSVAPAGNGTPLTATYTVAAPGGAWSADSDGTYTVTLLPNQVRDTSNLAAPTASFPFHVNVSATPTPTPTPTPTGVPAASLTPPADIHAAGGSTQTVTVTYSGAAPIDASTIVPAGLVVSGPAGLLTVTNVSLAPPTNANSITATYTVAAPGGAWESSANGTYTVSTVAGTVKDVTGAGAPGVSDTFNVAIAASGNLSPIDPSFNAGNPVVTGFVTESVSSDGDGKILVAGHQGNPAANTGQSVLQRLNPDGSLDTFFGAGGQIISDPTNDAFFAVTSDTTGRIVAVGQRGSSLLVQRFRPNGAFDRKFGNRGVALVGTSNSVAYAVAMAPNGSILVAGSMAGQGVILRLLPSGKLDPTFGTGGAFTLTAPTGTQAQITGIAVEPDGSVAAAGTSAASDGSAAAAFAMHLTGTGAPDAAFGPGGVRIVASLAPRSFDITDKVGFAVQSDGKILVASQTPQGNFGTVRLNPDGSPDATFGSNGLAETGFAGGSEANCVAVEATGQIYVTGVLTTGSATGQIAVAAYNADGSPLVDLAGTGTFTMPPSVTTAPGAAGTVGNPAGATHAYAGLQHDGRLLVGATDESPAVATASSLRRLNVTGSADVGSFGQLPGARGNTKLTFTADDGSLITLTLRGPGSGQALYDGQSVSLLLTGTGPRSAVTVTTKGAAGPLALGDVRSTGPLGSLTAKTATLTGTLFVNGALGTLTLASINHGTVAAAGAITSLTLSGAATSANVLSGADLGSDAQPGGAGSDADTFAAGSIKKLTVRGAVSDSLFAAGLQPPGGAISLVNLSGATVAGGASSSIASIAAGSLDAASRFVAGAFGKARVPGPVNPATDPRFVVL